MNPALLALLLTVSQGLVADPTNPSGQLTKHINPNNANATPSKRNDTFSYDPADPSNVIGFGLLRSTTADSVSGGLALVTTFENDALGRVVGVTPPKGHTGSTVNNAWTTKFTFNGFDELVQTLAPPLEGSGYRIKTAYTPDSNGNIIEIEQDNKDNTGAALRTAFSGAPNPILLTTIEYDSLNYPVLTHAEESNGTTIDSLTEYDANLIIVRE